MDPAVIGIACLILGSLSTGIDPGVTVPCFPPMPYGKVTEMDLPWQFAFFQSGTPEYAQLLAMEGSGMVDIPGK